MVSCIQYVNVLKNIFPFMKVQRIEDLRCWRASRVLVKEVFMACEEGKLVKDFDMKSQLRRAAVATMNNITEGFGRFNRKDSIKFYNISQGSAIEVLSMCYVLSDLDYLSIDRIAAIRQKAEETKNLTLAFIRSIRVKLQVTTPIHQHSNTTAH